MKVEPLERHHYGDPLEVAYWPWRDIIDRERKVMARQGRAPRCRVCRRPMLLGQSGAHRTCVA